MVGHDVTFGILLTDSFGYSNWNEVTDWVENYYQKNHDYPNFITSFPSVENDQLTLGFSVYLSRNINIDELDQQWKTMIESLPSDFLEIYNKYEKQTPDLNVVSGYY